MFKIQPNPTFTAKVGISVPGTAKPAEIEVEFKFLKRSAVKEFWDTLTGDRKDAEALAEVIVGWKGVDQPYSPAALETLLDNYPAAARDLFNAFSNELMASRQKN